MKADPQDLLTGIYADWDLVSNEEKDYVTAVDDLLAARGHLSPLQIKELKRFLQEVKTRARDKL
jgi:hypothetical protein